MNVATSNFTRDARVPLGLRELAVALGAARLVARAQAAQLAQRRELVRVARLADRRAGRVHERAPVAGPRRG